MIINSKLKMRKVFRPMQLFALMLLAGCSLCFTACSDDDDVKDPNEIDTSVMFGDYKGKMTSLNIAAHEGDDENGEAEPGIDVSATIENNTVRFEKFPIKDIVLSIVNDEDLANQIVEAVGDVNYNIEYVPALTAANDSIMMNLNPGPLKLTVTMPAENEGEEAQSLVVEVEVVAGEKKAGYAVENGNLKFNIDATKVMLGEGEDRQEFTGFVPTSFHFDMNQSRVSHN